MDTHSRQQWHVLFLQIIALSIQFFAAALQASHSMADSAKPRHDLVKTAGQALAVAALH